MAIHSVHPDIPGAVLFDDCERCREHADNPFDSLDDGNLTKLALAVKRDTDAVTNNDRLARYNIYHVIQKYHRLIGLGVY